MAKMLILSIPEVEETLIDKIMAVVNSTQDERGTELRKNVSVIHLVLGFEKHGEKGDKHVLEVVRGLSEEKKLFAAKILRGILNSLDE